MHSLTLEGTAAPDDREQLAAFNGHHWAPPGQAKRSLVGIGRLALVGLVILAVALVPVGLLRLPSGGSTTSARAARPTTSPHSDATARPTAAGPLVDLVDSTTTPTGSSGPSASGARVAPVVGAPPPPPRVRSGNRPPVTVTVKPGQKAPAASSRSAARAGVPIVTVTKQTDGTLVTLQPVPATVAAQGQVTAGSNQKPADAQATDEAAAASRSAAAAASSSSAAASQAAASSSSVAASRSAAAAAASSSSAAAAARAAAVGWLTPAGLSAAGLGGTVTIRATASGAALTSMVSDSDNSDYAMIRAIGGGQSFQLVSLGGVGWAIKASANGKYWCAETSYQDQGYGVIRARSNGVDSCEQFSLYRYEDGTIAIKSLANGRYLSVHPSYDGKWQAAVCADAGGVSSWSKFSFS